MTVYCSERKSFNRIDNMDPGMHTNVTNQEQPLPVESHCFNATAICFIDGRSEGMAFQQSSMSFHVFSSIFGLSKRTGRPPLASSRII